MYLQKVIIGLILLNPFLLLHAQEDKALARAQFMLRQVNAEKAQVQQQLNELKQEYELYKSETEKKLSQLESTEKKLKNNLGSWKESHGELQAAHEQTVEALAVQSEKTEILTGLLARQSRNLDTCRENNSNLVVMSEELVSLYQNKGFTDVMKGREPVTGIARVKVENIVQKYSHSIEDNDLQRNSYLLENLDASTVPTGETRHIAGADDMDAAAEN